MTPFHGSILAGKKALVLGVASDQSIAYGCAKALRAHGAEIALTYLNDKARPHVEPLAHELGASLFLPCDVTLAGSLEAVVAEISAHWGVLHSVVHSIAFAPREDLQGRVVDCSREGFLLAMDISCHSFMRLARLTEPLLRKEGGAVFTMSYFGAEKVVSHYNMMGPVKAALEAAVRYLAVELGPEIRVHAMSPGPMRTRAASGIGDFDELIERAIRKSPARRLATIDDVGHAVATLSSDLAPMLTGGTLYIDGGYNIVD
jgi:enoyl-[acyl-carrier protein] reductase I